MDPEIQSLGLQLADVAVRNSATTIAERINVARTAKKDRETIAILEDLISALIEDKNELTQIAQAYEQQLLGRSIGADDINFITSTLVPLLSELVGENGTEAQQQSVNQMATILSPELIAVMQLIGFDFRRAIGEPLTRLLADWISSKSPTDAPTSAQLEALSRQRELAYIQLASDPDAFDRLRSLTGS